MLSAEPRFADKVGVAPGTSTVYMPYNTVADLNGGSLGVISERNPWYTGRTTTPPGLPGTAVIKLNAEGGAAGLMGGGLGIIRNEINRSLSGHNGGFGISPTDAELGRMYGYTPVEAGWIVTGPGKSVSALGGVFDPLTDAVAIQKRQVLLQTITTGAFVTLAGVALYNAIKSHKKTSVFGRTRSR